MENDLQQLKAEVKQKDKQNVQLTKSSKNYAGFFVRIQHCWADIIRESWVRV